MSRTVRRKDYVPYWVCTDWERIEDRYQRVQLDGEKKKLALVQYHADWGTGAYWCGNAPAWFRRDLERVKRAKDKAELKRIMTKGDYEEYSFNPRRDDVGWLWW